jgi:hypothetical protein
MVEHVEGQILETRARGTGPDDHQLPRLVDVAVGLGGDHPGGLMDVSAEALAGWLIRHSAATYKET